MTLTSHGTRRASASGMKYELRFSDASRGIFATENIRQGATVLTLPLQTLDNPDEYSLEAWPGLHVDCSTSFAGAISHACKANCVVRNGKIVAWECIKAGDEICIDYRVTEAHLVNPFTCSCCGKLMQW